MQDSLASWFVRSKNVASVLRGHTRHDGPVSHTPLGTVLFTVTCEEAHACLHVCTVCDCLATLLASTWLL
jgi:hypothetical protein